MKPLIISLAAIALIIGGTFYLSGKSTPSTSQSTGIATIVDGKQVIEINAKGGYSPRLTTAKADMPTIIKMKTSGTFDCSSALVIPSLNYRTNLAPSGVTEIEVPPQKVGTTLQGLCSMGMYSFAVQFN